MMRPIVLTLGLLLCNLSTAALIDHGFFTRDTRTGLDWLDVTESLGYSHNELSVATAPGGDFEGWTLADSNLIATFYESFGAPGPYWPLNPNVDYVSPAWIPYVPEIQRLWGITRVGYYDVWKTSYNLSGVRTATTVEQPDANLLLLRDYEDNGYWGDALGLATTVMQVYDDSNFAGAALYRVSPVPIPATAWLFGSGLCALIAARRKVKINR